MNLQLPTIDADSYEATPVRYIRYRGVEHGVLNAFDLDQPTLTKLRNLGAELAAISTADGQAALIREIITKLAPTLPIAQLEEESHRKLLWLFDRLTDTAEMTGGR